MSAADRERWDAKYANRQALGAQPDDWLRQSLVQVPPGRALELGCGLGHNAIWLAEQGWQVDAVDISPVGLARAAELAHSRQAVVQWIAADLDDLSWEPPRSKYDLIVVFRFLDRLRLPQLIEESLAPGGLLVYETFSVGQLSRPDNHLKNPAFALNPGELPTLFPQLTALDYEEANLDDRCVGRLLARRAR